MSIALFAGVDGDKNFPPEIRAQLAKSNELKSTVVPMTESMKDNLSEADIWNGRCIYNLTKKAIEVWDDSNKNWTLILNTEFVPPDPVAPWDRYYVLPEEVRERLALSDDFKYSVVSLDYRAINQLMPEDLWDGRVIFNTTIEQHQFWDADREIWIKLLNSTYIPPKTHRTQKSYAGEISLTNGTVLATGSNADTMAYLNQNNCVSLYFDFGIDSEDLTETGFAIRASLPLVNSIPLGFKCFGFGQITRYLISLEDEVTTDVILILNGGEQYVTFYYYDRYNGEVLDQVADNSSDQTYILINGSLRYYESS